MKTSICLITVFLLSLGAMAQCADTANIYTFQYNNKKYEIVKEMKNWPGAAACAVERGGYLVHIGSQGEQDAVLDAILNGAGISPTYVSIFNGGDIAYVWIGATDKATEGTWLWDGDGDDSGDHFWSGEGANGANNGSPAGGAYHNWGGKSDGTPNEPDDYAPGQDAGAIGLTGWPSGTTWLGIAGEWNDIKENSLIYYVIEFDSTSTGMDDNKEQGMNIFPNPADDYISISGMQSSEVQIYDMVGRLTAIDNRAKIDISDLTSGLYMVFIRDGDKVFTRKLLVQ